MAHNIYLPIAHVLYKNIIIIMITCSKRLELVRADKNKLNSTRVIYDDISFFFAFNNFEKREIDNHKKTPFVIWWRGQRTQLGSSRALIVEAQRTKGISPFARWVVLTCWRKFNKPTQPARRSNTHSHTHAHTYKPLL